MGYTIGLFHGLKEDNLENVDYIQGEKFERIADYCYAPKTRHRDDYNGLVNTFELPLLKDNDVIYTHTFYVAQLFRILQASDKKVYIITHNSDINIDHTFGLPDNIIKWYAQNVAIVNDRIISIPIGLENSHWSKLLHKRDKMEAKCRTNKMVINLAYMCHTIKTNPGERGKLYDMFIHKPWITVDDKAPFDEYLHSMYNHPFMVCPNGNGIDTHRTWECLYIGTIPIQKRDINNQFYTDLPICFVDDWNQLNEEFLLKEFDRINSTSWNMDKLTFKYWRNLICKK